MLALLGGITLVVEIARLPGTHDFLDQQQHSGLEPPVRGILLMRPEEPLFFANAETILKNIQQRIQTLHSQIVIISMEMCDDLDSTTVEAIGEFIKMLEKNGQILLFARLKDKPRQALERAGLTISLGENRFFWSVDDAYQQAIQLINTTTRYKPSRINE